MLTEEEGSVVGNREHKKEGRMSRKERCTVKPDKGIREQSKLSKV